MNITKWLSALPQFLILLPTAASCYLLTEKQMKYTPARTAALCLAVLIPYALTASWVHAALKVSINLILLLSLVPFFFLFRATVKTDLPLSLAIYVGVCAIETFPIQFAYLFDACRHPLSGAANLSAEAAFFRFGLSCVLLAAFVRPARRHFSQAVDNFDFPKIWYSTVILSSAFLIFNVLAVPLSYRTLHTGRMLFLFPLLEICALALLTSVYVLFYRGTAVIVEHAKLKERSQLLEMQAHQYHMLQEHMSQTARLRHDFRHSVHLLSSLAEKGDISNIQAHLTEYETRLTEHVPANYCTNAALNALFGYYHEMAVSSGIHTDWHIHLPEPLAVSELDLTALFGNLMENAIAGCLSLPERSRYFSLTTEIRHKNSLYIVSTNSFDGHVRKEKDRYRSTKHNGNGIGLASITATAEKHGGSARFSNNDREFFADVVLRI